MTAPAPQRWLVLPGLACPASSFDAVRAELHRRGAGVELVVLDAWEGSFLGTDPLTALGGRSFDGVVGHSLGGLLAIQAAQGHPERVGRLLLLDPTPLEEDGPPAAVRRVLDPLVPRVLALAGATGLLRRVGALIDRRGPFAAVPGSGSFTPTAVWQRIWQENRVGWDRARHLGRRLAPPPAAAPVDVPLTHLVATRAGQHDLRLQDALAARLRTTAVPVEDAGHLLMLDRPDAVADALVRLAARPAVRAGRDAPSSA